MNGPADCAQCGRRLADGEGRPVPSWLVWLAATGFAFFHGGLWAHETLRKSFCRRCRTLVVSFGSALALLAMAGAAFGVYILVRGPIAVPHR